MSVGTSAPDYYAFADSKAAWVDICDELPQFADWADPALVKRLFNGVD